MTSPNDLGWKSVTFGFSLIPVIDLYNISYIILTNRCISYIIQTNSCINPSTCIYKFKFHFSKTLFTNDGKAFPNLGCIALFYFNMPEKSEKNNMHQQKWTQDSHNLLRTAVM